MRPNVQPQASPQQSGSRLPKLPFNLFFCCVAALLYTPLLVIYLSRSAGPLSLAALEWPAMLCLVSLLIPCLLWLRWRASVETIDTLLLAPALYILIATTFVPVHGNVLDGTESVIGRGDRLWHDGLMGVCVIVALLSIFHALLRSRLKQLVNLLGMFAVASSTYVAASVLPLHADDRDTHHYAAALSAKHNVIVVMLDMLQGSFGLEYFRRHPAAEDTFDGFAFYRNTASFAPFTALSYSGLMSGGYPGPDQVLDGSVRDTIYYKENIVDDMVGRQYATRYFSVIPYQNSNEKVIRIPDDIGLTRKENFFLTALTMRGRYLPYTYLPFGIKYMPWTQREFGMFSKTDARDSLEWFTRNLEVDQGVDKGFVWFHSLITHQPIRFSSDGHFSMALRPDDVNGEVAYAFGQLQGLLAHLEQLGVYDDSTVIILSDHGYNILQRMKEMPAGAEYALAPFGNGIAVGQYEPLIMVKRPHAHGKLSYDDSAVTLLDLRKSLRELASPGAASPMDGFDFLSGAKGSPIRTVPVIRFVGSTFDPGRDFTSLDNWRRDTLKLPLRANYGAVPGSNEHQRPQAEGDGLE